MKSTYTSTAPLLSERAGGDACLYSLHSKIDPSKLAAGVVLQARRLCRFNPESTVRSSEADLSGRHFCLSTERRRSKVWYIAIHTIELVFRASDGYSRVYVFRKPRVKNTAIYFCAPLDEAGRLPIPLRVTAFRLTSTVIRQCDSDYI